DAEVDEAHRASFKKLVVQRAEGCPVAYLVGSREFYSLDFKVTRATLVPRPETEHVVAEALKFGRHGEAIRFLDIGTGTGAIAVTLLHLCPAWSAVAVDVSPEALEVAKENARAHGAA